MGGLLVALWVLRRLFRSFRRLVLLLVLVLGAAWLMGGDALSDLFGGLGLTPD